jgi:hypothetical protein
MRAVWAAVQPAHTWSDHLGHCQVLCQLSASHPGPHVCLTIPSRSTFVAKVSGTVASGAVRIAYNTLPAGANFQAIASQAPRKK